MKNKKNIFLKAGVGWKHSKRYFGMGLFWWKYFKKLFWGGESGAGRYDCPFWEQAKAVGAALIEIWTADNCGFQRIYIDRNRW